MLNIVDEQEILVDCVDGGGSVKTVSLKLNGFD